MLHFAIIQRTKSTPHDYKICTPFYPERFIRGNLNFLRDRLYRTFCELLNFEFCAFCDNTIYVLASKTLRNNNKIESLVAWRLDGNYYGVCLEGP